MLELRVNSDSVSVLFALGPGYFIIDKIAFIAAIFKKEFAVALALIIAWIIMK